MKKIIECSMLIAALAFPAMVLAQQDRDWRDRGGDRDWDRMTRIEPGTTIPVRVNQSINADRDDYDRNQIYTGTVDQDVYGENGRLAIPRGAQVNLRVRVARDNDLVLDLDSVMVRDREYRLPVSPDRIESQRDVVGNIIGAVTGQEVRGRAVRVERGTVLTFRMNQPLEMRAIHGDRQ